MREALARPDRVVQIYATASAIERQRGLLDEVLAAGRPPLDVVSDKAAAALSETVTPQGLVAVCRQVPARVDEVLGRAPRLLVVLVEPNEPGNVGAIVRTADAAGADAVIISGGADPFSGKAVRASAGSLFHLPVAVVDGEATATVLSDIVAAGLAILATSGRASADLDDLTADGTLERPTAWIFGNEAQGLSAEVVAAASRSVRIPMYGRAESLNLAAAAAVCLYASARVLHRRSEHGAALGEVTGSAG